MKKIIIILTLSIGFSAFSQEKLSLEAEDGTKIEVDILNNNPDEGKNIEAYMGVFGVDGIHILGFSYNIPKIANLNIGLGVNNYWFDGSVFAFSWKKSGFIKQSLKYANTGINSQGQSTITKYIGKLPTDKRRSIGMHLGGNVFKFGASKNPASISATSLFAGITMLRATHVNWRIKDNEGGDKIRQGTLINKIHADYVKYFNPSVEHYPIAVETFEDSYYIRDAGFRVYLDGKATFWSEKGRLSLHYMIGVGVNIEKQKSLDIPFGLGFGFNFK